MKLRLRALASKVGFHKPRERPPYESDPPAAVGQGGSLVSSMRESARAILHSSPNRRPAVVGLAAPPYGLPSPDPTTPARTVQLRCTVRPSSLCSSGSRWWSAHADDRARSEFPLDPLLSRANRPLWRPADLRTEDVLSVVLFSGSVAVSASQGWLL